MRLLFGSTMVAGCAAMAVAVAGCGTTHATTGSLTATASRSTSRSPATPSAATPRQRAVADAAAILASFVVPPGARRLPKAPDVAGGVLRSASDFPVSTALVDDASWWLAPGQPEAVLAWEKAHLPRRFVPGDSSFGIPGESHTFSLPPVPGVLNTRDLVVEVVSAGGGQTAIRVDAQVTWQPPRASGEQVPSAARVVMITQLPSLLPRSKRPPAPVTITDAAVVRRLAALVDGLPISTLGNASCPAMLGGGIQLAFRARVGGPPLAVVNSAGGCGTVLLTIDGKQQPALTGSATFVPQVLKAAGLHWRVN